MQITPIIRQVAWQRELAHYPATPARAWYLIMTLSAQHFGSGRWLEFPPH
jgi:hypothetical protein